MKISADDDDALTSSNNNNIIMVITYRLVVGSICGIVVTINMFRKTSTRRSAIFAQLQYSFVGTVGCMLIVIT